MQAAAVSLLLVSASLAQYGPPQRFYGHGPIKKDELEYQQQAFKQWWGTEYVTKLDELPKEGKVADYRVPYSGHDYPDMGGGTLVAMYKYDRAFRSRAADFERFDISEHRNARDGEDWVRGPFGRMRMVRSRHVPTWYGHCNGWTAAAIRHAEPQKSVVRNGVVFTPADIKGLLAEIYMYNDSEFLGGVDPAINPGILHLTLGNWLGRGAHPLGMETAVGEVVINFPVFNYKFVINKYSTREAEVRTWITYALNINREMDKAPEKYHRQMYFHYVLELENDGTIRGGRFYGDSMQIDMLWAPLKPEQGGKERNKRGNPHLDVKEVLAIWRESVPEDLRKQWLNIDPTEEDRVLPPEEAVVAAQPPAAAATEPTSDASVATTEAETASTGTTSDGTTSDRTSADGATGDGEAAESAGPEAPAPEPAGAGAVGAAP